MKSIFFPSYIPWMWSFWRKQD